MNNLDYTGARGSNTGDQFHELWALQQVLDLLQPETDLMAVGVEGVRTLSPSQNDDSLTWDGVDCTLYYEGTKLETANRIEFVQLKYSAANPETAWSVARLTRSTQKRGNNSIIHKMANEFNIAKARMKPDAQLKIRFISNQDLSVEFKKALATRWSGPLEEADIGQAIVDALKSLMAATNLDLSSFQDFLETLDFSECGSHSRFAVRERVVATIANLLGNDVLSEVRELQVRVRELMLPERTREIVTDKDILSWFGMSGREGLFPCPPDIQIPEHTVERSTANEVVRLLTEGKRLVLVHGVGGCGKTTLMQQIADRLPDESVTVFFDCWGGGSCGYSDDKRHLPENAFLHLVNELAVAIRLPLFIPRSTRYPVTIKSFLGKLRSAGEALIQFAPHGILLIIIDAADNSVAAANKEDPPDRHFVHELFGANLSELPKNVRIITSCRTNSFRRASLQLPPYTPEVICSPFTRPESQQHLEIAFSDPIDSLVEQFHHLSNKNPRVQAYAIAAANGDRTRLLEALMPGGKSLPDVLRSNFSNALHKLGQPQIFEKLVDALAFLPAPIAVNSIARIAGCTENTIRDFALDLWPGLRLHGNDLTIADEDFDVFIKDKGSTNHNAIISDIAEDFITTFQNDPYSSIHVADILIDAGRAQDVLSIIEHDPKAAAITDPIVRRQVQVRRLKLSLTACREAGSTRDTLKTILISAEAEHDDRTLNEMLEKELDLSVEFGGSSLRRVILLDSDRIKDHGSFLAQDAVRAIRAGDRVTAREQLYFHEAWLSRRKEVGEELGQWTITDRDISARVEAMLELVGPNAAFNELRRWSPRNVSLRVAYILVPQLIAAGKVHHVKTLLKKSPSSGPWDLLLWVPLAMAGESVNKLAIEKSLRRIRRCFIPDTGAFRIAYGDNEWQEQLLDTFITACELAFKLDLNSQVILNSSNRIQEVLEGKQASREYGSNIYRLDGLLRCWLLKKAIQENPAKEEEFIEYIKTINPGAKPEKQPHSNRHKKSDKTSQEDREIERVIRKGQALFPVYSARVEILSCARRNQQITAAQLDELGSIASHVHDFDYDHDSTFLREIAARSVMSLLVAENIEASDLVKRASTLAIGRFSDSLANRRVKLWARMLLRTSESDKLLRLVAEAMEDIKEMRATSSDKLEAIIHLSRLILPVSREDSQALFNNAIDIAKEIDHEALDQIDFVSVLAERARIPKQSDRRTIASDIFAFVSGAAEVLSDQGKFPWRSAVHALTCVDNETAISAISRWEDDGTVKLDDTLDQFLLTSLQRGIIGPEVSTSLALLIGGSRDDLRKELISRAVEETQKYKKVIEELARETLLLSPQHARLPLGQEIIDQMTPGYSGGLWNTHLSDMITFLGQITDNKPDEITVNNSNNMPHLTNNNRPKQFEFDPQGKSFTTWESIVEILKAANLSGLGYSESDLLKKMRNESSNPRDKVPFLNALAKTLDYSIWPTDRFDVILETLGIWKGTPAVDHWCRDTLPSVMIKHFHGATQWLKERRSVLRQLLDYTESDDESRLQIILVGVAQVGEAMDSRTLFAIAEEIASAFDADEAGELLLWYSQRLQGRLPLEDQVLYSPTELPNDKTEAIARFLFALMSDIDTRVRWRAAHALRLLAKLGCSDIVKATVSQSSRVRDDAFRDPSGPFYFLAAKLWLTISLYRISAETPEALKSCKVEIFDVATSLEIPHVGIREYAKRTLLQLASTGTITLTEPEYSQVNQVNTALKGKTGKNGDVDRSFNNTSDDKHRFKFDQMDTIPYWYDRILRIFPTLSLDQFLENAERWILDRWDADPEANWWNKEPRKSRYHERRYNLWLHSHGSLPTIERYGTYLELNAMYCVVGELLTTHQISEKDELYFDSFDYWLGSVLPSNPPAWLSDNRGPTPLEDRLWKEDLRTDRGWLHNTRRDEFLTEVGIRPPFLKGWIVVDGCYTASFPKREANIQINSALVYPETASALVRALQTASNPRNFRIPDEDDELQIDAQPYRFIGWIAHVGGDLRFDEHDPFRYEVRQIQAKPGRILTESFGLVPQAGSHNTWICSDTNEAVLFYEAWCDEPPPEENYYRRSTRSEGWRLWAKSDMVQSFITNEGLDLICEVQIERQLRNEYGGSYEADSKRKTHEKILLLQANGSVADDKGRIGSWTGVS